MSYSIILEDEVIWRYEIIGEREPETGEATTKEILEGIVELGKGRDATYRVFLEDKKVRIEADYSSVDTEDLEDYRSVPSFKPDRDIDIKIVASTSLEEIDNELLED